MSQAHSNTLEPFDTMPFGAEIRASAKCSVELRRRIDQIFELMRGPVKSEAESRARLIALQTLAAQSVPYLRPKDAIQKTAISSGAGRRPPSSKFV